MQTSSWWPIATGPVLALLLSLGVLDSLPALARVLLAFVVLVLLPGFGWSRVIGVRGPGGAWLASGWALGYGVAWLGLCVLATRAMGLPFTVLAEFGALWALPPWLVALAAVPRPAAGAKPPSLSPVVGIVIVLAAAFAAAHVFAVGTPVSWFTDSPDHIGTIRRMLASGDAFPTDAFFRNAGASGADPRKGLWHPAVALVCALSHADPLVAWRLLAVLLAPLFVLNAAAFAFRLGGGFAAAIGAWALPITYGGGLGAQYLSEAVFATKLADQLALATATAMLVDLETRSRRSRAAVMALALGTVCTHVFGAIQFAITFGALTAGLWVRDRSWAPAARRAFATSLSVAIALVPYVAWRASQAYAPVNIIHTQVQGMLELANGVSVISVGVLWDWLGPAWILFPLSLVAWARASREPAALYLLTTTLAVVVLMFFPPVVAILSPRLGYLLMRLPWLLPSSAAVAFLACALRDAWRQRRRALFAGIALVLFVALAGPLGDAAHAWIAPRHLESSESEASVLRWADALAWMDRELPLGTVVLTDPATAYSIPMLTRHWVTLLADQHSSPNDSLALARILDARDALDPYGDWSRTRAVVRRWGATVVALNGRVDAGPALDYWASNPDWCAAARERLDREPAAFERVYDHDRFVVYRIHRDALERLSGPARRRAFTRPATAADTPRPVGRDVPGLVSFRLGSRSLAHGDTLAGALEWRALAPLPAGSYHVAVRFDRPLPAGTPAAPAAISKVWRKLLERVWHERYRFRGDHLPTGGAYGVDRWRPDEVVRDTFRVVVPHDVAPGQYRVKVTMVHASHYPNLRLLDLTSDNDMLNGLELGRLRIVPRRGR